MEKNLANRMKLERKRKKRRSVTTMLKIYNERRKKNTAERGI